MKDIIEHIEGIGTILFAHSKRAKRISIRINANGDVRVAMPFYSNIDEAREFLLLRKGWVIKTRKKILNKQAENLIQPEKGLTTHYHKFQFNIHSIKKVTANIESGYVHIKYPDNIDVDNPDLQTLFRKIYIEVLRKEAKFYLPKRLKELSVKHRFRYNELRIKNIKSRWGSCSSRNNINLSIHIMKLPKHLIDFILLHELCHTIHKNHGPKFHKLLNKVCPEAEEYNKEVRKYRIFKE